MPLLLLGCSLLGFGWMKDFLSKWFLVILWFLFMNVCKCNVASLVLVEHSLGSFLNNPALLNLLESY
jgi:hypothetical protein